jgi:hypothetical protein
MFCSVERVERGEKVERVVRDADFGSAASALAASRRAS